MLAFTLVIVAKRLRPYFQVNPMKVLIDVPLRTILQKPDVSSPMMNWVIELSEFDIEYLPCTTIKGQVLADFIAEYSDFLEETPIVPQGKP